MAARAAVARLDASRYQLITIPNPQVGAPSYLELSCQTRL